MSKFRVSCWVAAAWILGQAALPGVVEASGPAKGQQCIVSYTIEQQGNADCRHPGIDCDDVDKSLRLYNNQPLHRVHPATGMCVDGILKYDLASCLPAFSGILFQVQNPYTVYECEYTPGENSYCLGSCPSPAGTNGCASITIQSNKCSENGGNAIIEPGPLFCAYEQFNKPATFTNETTGTCYPASSCLDGTYTIPGATCEDVTGTLSVCWNRDCSTRRERRRSLLLTDSFLTSSSNIEPNSPIYREIADKCGHMEYNVSLFVNRHFYAIATPKNHEGEDEDGTTTASSCPTIITQAEFKDQKTYYHKVVNFFFDQQDINSLVGANPDDDSLFVGTFPLKELRRAHESIDPAQKDKKAYDIILNNCADYMISLAEALKIKVDSKITSYVTRRLLQQSGQELMAKIRSSMHFESLFAATTSSSSSSNDVVANHRSLLRAHHGQEEGPPLPPPPSDEVVIQALVDARAGNLIMLEE